MAVDGSHVALVDAETEQSIWVMESEEGEARIALTAREGNWFTDIAWSPIGTRLAFIQRSAESNRDLLGAVDMVTRDATQVIGGMSVTSGPEEELSGLCWSRDGRIFFVLPTSSGAKGSDLWAIPVDPHLGTPTGHKALVTSNPGIYWSDLRSTGDGKLAFLKVKIRYSVFLGTLQGDSAAGGRFEGFLAEESNNWVNDWTPDSRYVLITSDRKSGVQDIYRQALSGGGPKPLALGDGSKADAVALSDGSSVLYWPWPKKAGGYPKDKKLQELPMGQSSQRTLSPMAVPCSAALWRLQPA